MKSKNRISIIVYNAMFSVASIILAFIGNLAIFPVFPFLKADLSDAPAFLAALISGASSGITVLMTVSIIRTFLFSASGFIGFVIRSTSIFVVLGMSIFGNKKIPFLKRLTILCLSILICITLKLYLNNFFWINFFFISKEVIDSLMYVVVIPYNTVKILTNILLAIFTKKFIDKCLKNKNINQES